MKVIMFIVALSILIHPAQIGCYPVNDPEKCRGTTDKNREITGVIGNVITGERPFLTLIKENGDEFIMMPENATALEFFRKNKGKKVVANYNIRQFLFSEDFSENGPGACIDVYFFKSAKLIE